MDGPNIFMNLKTQGWYFDGWPVLEGNLEFGAEGIWRVQLRYFEIFLTLYANALPGGWFDIFWILEFPRSENIQIKKRASHRGWFLVTIYPRWGLVFFTKNDLSSRVFFLDFGVSSLGEYPDKKSCLSSRLIFGYDLSLIGASFFFPLKTTSAGGCF